MKIRKLPWHNDENPSKRARNFDIDIKLDIAASFDSLLTDCKVVILSFLSPDEMNIVACCSKDWSQARTHESLNQDRSGTICLSRQTTEKSLFRVIQIAKRIFSGRNYKCLIIMGLEKLQVSLHNVDIVYLEGVEKLKVVPYVPSLSFDKMEAKLKCVQAIINLCPNATDISMECLQVRDKFPFGHSPYWHTFFPFEWPRKVERLEWSNATIELDGVSHLTTLIMDDTTFSYDYESLNPNRSEYLFDNCPKLERVSIKGAQVIMHRRGEPDPWAERMLDEIIIKFVRRHPTLRWLRCDLSERHVAMLKEERPDVTFVS